jgi:hypothetical protein
MKLVASGKADDYIDVYGISEKERTLVLGHCYWEKEPVDPQSLLDWIVKSDVVSMLPKGKVVGLPDRFFRQRLDHH